MIKAKKDFCLDGKDYFAGEEINTNDIKVISRLNEKGFIEPLSRKEIILLSREKGGKEKCQILRKSQETNS